MGCDGKALRAMCKTRRTGVAGGDSPVVLCRAPFPLGIDEGMTKAAEMK